MSNLSELQIMDGLKRAIADVLKAKPDEISMDTDFRADLAADSVDMASLLLAVEDEFGRAAIAEQSLGGLKTVGDAVALIKQTLRADASPG